MRQGCALCLGGSLGIRDWNVTRGGGVRGGKEWGSAGKGEILFCWFLNPSDEQCMCGGGTEGRRDGGKGS